MQVFAPELNEPQFVDDLRLELVDLLGDVVQEGVVTPPANPWVGSTCEQGTVCISDLDIKT